MISQWFFVQKINPYLYAIAEFEHWEKVISYLLVGKTKSVLIDTGMGYKPIIKIVRQITDKPVLVLLTHSHWDHIGSVQEFNDVLIYDDKFEKSSLEKGFKSSAKPKLRNSKYYNKPFKPKVYNVPGCTNYGVFHDGDIISLDSYKIKIIHSPGHTPGSTCFFLTDHNLLFTGDVLYSGPLYLHLPESNFSDFLETIDNLSNIVIKNTLILPGHNRIICDYSFFSKVYSGINNIRNNIVIPKVYKDSEEIIVYSFSTFSILTQRTKVLAQNSKREK